MPPSLRKRVAEVPAPINEQDKNGELQRKIVAVAIEAKGLKESLEEFIKLIDELDVIMSEMKAKSPKKVRVDGCSM